jgi:hypothetical protein
MKYPVHGENLGIIFFQKGNIPRNILRKKFHQKLLLLMIDIQPKPLYSGV